MCLKRIFASLLCVAMLITGFASCNVKDKFKDTIGDIQKTEPDPGIDKIGYTLPYLRTDSLHPYECESDTNRNLTVLIYDSLVRITDEFRVEMLIAHSFEKDGKIITVNLKSGVKFTDGSDVTADDVVYSFNLAKQSDYYADYLRNITDAEASGSSAVIFRLRDDNPHEVNNLIFPIVQKDSDKDSDSSDSYSAELPLGSGRYSIKEDESGKKTLTVNKQRLDGYHPKYNNIGLKDITEAASVPNLFSFGEVDFYTESFSSGTYKRFTGESGEFETTNFTYLGINSSTKVLNESNVRRAIALLINRPDLASVSFAGFGVATTTPFHPSFHGLEGCTLPPIKHDTKAAIGLLEDAGYDIVSEIGIRYAPEKGKLEISLLVNKDNSFKLAIARNIQQALAEADIRVVLKEYSYAKYVSAVEAGAYDLYIGEARLSNSFDLSVFFTEGGVLGYGIDAECESAKDYHSYENGDKTMQEFLDTFADELPFIPLAYRKGLTVRSEKIKTKNTTIVSDYYFNIDEWTVE